MSYPIKGTPRGLAMSHTSPTFFVLACPSNTLSLSNLLVILDFAPICSLYEILINAHMPK